MMDYAITKIGGKNFALYWIKIDKTDAGAEVIIVRKYFIAKHEKITFVIHLKFNSVYCVALVAAGIVVSFE